MCLHKIKEKLVGKDFIVSKIKPETKWSIRVQIAAFMPRIEPVYVAKYWDDMRIGVKG